MLRSWLIWKFMHAIIRCTTFWRTCDLIMIARLILRKKRFETPNRQEPIRQDRNSGQLFRPYWDSSALCSEDGEQVSSKYGTWYSERVTLQFMYVGCWAGVTYLRYTVLTSPNKDQTAVHCCDPALSVLGGFGVSKRFFVVSALQSIVYLHIFFGWSDLL